MGDIDKNAIIVTLLSLYTVKFRQLQQTKLLCTSKWLVTDLLEVKFLTSISRVIRPKKKISLIALSPLKKKWVGRWNIFFFFINTIFECKMRPEFLMKVS